MIPPVSKVVKSGQPAGGIGNGHPEALRSKEFREPAAHFAVAADDQCLLAAAVPMSGHPRLLLGRQGRLDELPQQRFGKIRLEPQALRDAAAAQDDLPLARKVARGAPAGALDGRDLLAQPLTAGH